MTGAQLLGDELLDAHSRPLAYWKCGDSAHLTFLRLDAGEPGGSVWRECIGLVAGVALVGADARRLSCNSGVLKRLPVESSARIYVRPVVRRADAKRR